MHAHKDTSTGLSGTCINEAVVEMQTEQRGSHATLIGNSSGHDRLNGAQSIRARGVIESRGQLSGSHGDEEEK